MSVCGFLFKIPLNTTTGVAWRIPKLLPGRSHCSWRIIPGLFSYVDTVQPMWAESKFYRLLGIFSNRILVVGFSSTSFLLR